MNDHNDNNIEKIFDDFKKISLTEAERTAMFSRVDKFVAAYPAKSAKPVATPYFSWSFFAVHTKGLAFAMVIFIILGSTSAAAQYSLPGEALYSVKVNINEEVRSFFALGEVAKAKFESKRAKERLKEASVLARNGKLSGEVKEEIEVKLGKHIAAVQENVAKLKSEGSLNEALDLGTDLEVTLRSSEDELAGISTEVAVTDDTQVEDVTVARQPNHLSDLVTTVAEEIEKTSVARLDTETTISDSNNEETIKLAAETKRDAAKKVLALMETDDREASEPTQQDAKDTKPEVEVRTKNAVSLMVASAPIQTKEEIIASIKALIEEGEKYLENGMHKEAFDSFNTAFELENTLQSKEEKTPEVLEVSEVKPEVKGVETETIPKVIHKIRFDKEKELN